MEYGCCADHPCSSAVEALSEWAGARLVTHHKAPAVECSPHYPQPIITLISQSFQIHAAWSLTSGMFSLFLDAIIFLSFFSFFLTPITQSNIALSIKAFVPPVDDSKCHISMKSQSKWRARFKSRGIRNYRLHEMLAPLKWVSTLEWYSFFFPLWPGSKTSWPAQPVGSS